MEKFPTEHWFIASINYRTKNNDNLRFLKLIDAWVTAYLKRKSTETKVLSHKLKYILDHNDEFINIIKYDFQRHGLDEKVKTGFLFNMILEILCESHLNDGGSSDFLQGIFDTKARIYREMIKLEIRKGLEKIELPQLER